MKKLNELLKRPWAAYTFATCSAVMLFVIFGHLPEIFSAWKKIWAFISPVIIGIVIAYLLNPLSEFFKNRLFRKMKNESARHIWAVVLTVVCLVVALAVVLGSLIPAVVKSVSSVVSNWDSYVTHINNLIEKITPLADKIGVDLSNLSSMTKDLMNKALELLQKNKDNILNAISAAGSSISNFAVGVLFGVCFLVAKGTILSIFSKLRSALIKKDRIERNNELFSRFHSVFSRYVVCTLADALIVGVCSLVFMLFDNPSYAALIAVIVAITNIIPTFGPMIGSAISIFFLVLDKPWSALWFFIFICVLQSIDGMIIKPRLFKGGLGIPGVWTLVLIILGGKVAGMLGIILSIPFAAILVILYKETILPRLEKRSDKINRQVR